MLLVSPRFYMGRNRLSLLPLAGIGYLAESLKDKDIKVSVLDMNLGHDVTALISRIEEFRPDIIGFTVMTLGYRYFYDMVNKLKERYPEIKTVVGGAHISALKEQVLRDCPGIDYGIILEGERSIAKLCCGEELANIGGLLYYDKDRIVANPPEDFINNLDEIPFPKYSDFELDKYPTKQLGIVTSRGCPYDCIYCSVIATSGKRFRVRGAQGIVDEIAYWHNRGYREIFILDDNFTLIHKRVEDVCRLLKQLGLRGLHLKCPNGIRADKVDRRLLESMREAGFDFIAFGVEAANNRILKNIKKGQDIEHMEESIRDACELGFDVDLFFLIGSPGETMEDVEESFALARRYPLRRAIFYNLIPLPATELLQWLQENGYLVYPLDKILNNASYYNNEPCFFTPEMSVDERKSALIKGQKVMIDIRRGYIERKMRTPSLFKKLFSYVYTYPVFDDALNNNRLIVQFKERLKSALKYN